MKRDIVYRTTFGNDVLFWLNIFIGKLSLCSQELRVLLLDFVIFSTDIDNFGTTAKLEYKIDLTYCFILLTLLRNPDKKLKIL